MIYLLLRTGMRIGELLKTTMDDIDLREHLIRIYESEKTSTGRVVYFSNDAAEALFLYLQERDMTKEKLFYGRLKMKQPPVTESFYEPRHPMAGRYYRCIETNFEELEMAWDDRYERRYGYWRPYIMDLIYIPGLRQPAFRFRQGQMRYLRP
jgi:hypothetical protein